MVAEARIVITILALIAGLSWTLPVHPGRNAAGPELAPQPIAPQFTLRVQRDTLVVDGHARSAQHEQRLRDAVAASYPAHSLQANFLPLGLVPDWWEAATLELIAALPATLSPKARLRHDTLIVEALASDAATAKQRLASLQHVLPADVSVAVNLETIGPGVDTTGLCRRAFAHFEHAQVRFEESGTTMRSSAYPVLDRVVALADTCRHGRVAIVGHTDASGIEVQNRQLSLARAQAVAAWLETRGIDADRMDVSGAGSAMPVADNATRYGRSLNRRIEIRLLPSAETTPAPSG